MELNGTAALVTGAARGIGKAIAEGLARRGARVALADVLECELGETADRIQHTGATALAVRTDITDYGQVQAMAGKVRQEFGPVDILINNAGSLSALGPVWEVDAQRWARDVTVNLIGTFLVTRAVIADMIERRRGYVISLVGAGVDAPHLYTTGYDTSKAGVVRLTEALAREAGEFGIKTFTLSPGTVLTKMTEFIRDSDQGRRWRPQFKEYLDRTGGMPADLAVQACLKILSGAADALSGRWLSATRDFNDYVSQSDTIVRENLLTLRLRPLH
jgi:NAD(P)-dependent dehydrogenase (short-subunit alcohol dehydrogenase family)